MRSLQVSEAGDIEQDASIIILLWNLDNEDKTRKGLKVDKNRQGELGKIVYRFDGKEMRFQETEEELKSKDGFKTVRTPTPFDKKMGSVKLLKGSEEFEMFQDYWKMMQSVWSVENTKEYWEKVVEDTDRFYRKYQTEFSKELALALANELERKAKHEAEQTTVQERMGIHFGRCRGTSWGE